MSRSIIIRMRRRAPGERIEQFRRRLHAKQGTDLCTRLKEWAELVGETVAEAWPDLPDGVENRDVEVWEPLLAMADAAGGGWPEQSRLACVELCKVAKGREASLGIRLLGDLRQVFGKEPALPTKTILEELCKIEAAPWSNLKGEPLDARGLAWRLRQYEISSTDINFEGHTLKGYRREDLWDAWQRYLPPSPAEEQSPQSPQLPRSEASEKIAEVADIALPQGEGPRSPQLPIQQAVAHTEAAKLCADCGLPMRTEEAPLSDTCRARLKAHADQLAIEQLEDEQADEPWADDPWAAR